MNVLELDRVDTPQAGHALRILVDGRDLVDWAREVETHSAAADKQAELAGSYFGPSLWRIHDLTSHMLGEPDPLYGEEGWVELLVCANCGEPGCWPFEVKIQVERDHVIWSQFRQPHRPHWDHQGMPQFAFDRHQYEAAIIGLKEKGWRGPDAA